MEETKILNVKTATLQEMLDRPEKEYNPAIWNSRIRVINTFNPTFYIAEPQGGFNYARFYAVYKTPEEGLKLFNEISPFCTSLTNRGFSKIRIDDNGNVYRSFFNNEKGRAANTPLNRKGLSRDGVLVTTDF